LFLIVYHYPFGLITPFDKEITIPQFIWDKYENIDGKYYIDGGVYSDCPVDMLIDAGYEEIYVIKAFRDKIK
jgi:predicted patatin/cPLA2 family phospholipase